MKFNLFNKLKTIPQRFEPIHLMLFAIALIVLLVLFIQHSYTSKYDLSVTYQDLPLDNAKATRKKRLAEAGFGDSDPNTQLSQRVMEANGIAGGLLQYCLYRYFVKNAGVPTDTVQLLNEFQTSELRPPFVQNFTPTGGLVTDRGVYWIKYSQKPLMIVVLSSGQHSSQDGAVFVLRTPDASAQNIADKQGIKSAVLTTLYVAPYVKDGVIPPPFAIASEYAKVGWSVEPLRLTDISADRLDAVNRMLSNIK